MIHPIFGFFGLAPIELVVIMFFLLAIAVCMAVTAGVIYLIIRNVKKKDKNDDKSPSA